MPTFAFRFNVKLKIDFVMQQEDDLRGLAKVMDFMRALSILFVVINVYWFCYGAIEQWGIQKPVY
jgi:hypothetical protein